MRRKEGRQTRKEGRPERKTDQEGRQRRKIGRRGTFAEGQFVSIHRVKKFWTKKGRKGGRGERGKAKFQAPTSKL